MCAVPFGATGYLAPIHRTMKPTESNTLRTSDSTAPCDDDKPELAAYPAGENHENLLLTGPENDTQWIMSDSHVDVQEER